MKRILYFVLLFLFVTSCQSQTEKRSQAQVVGGVCQGCEAVLEYDAGTLQSVDTLPDFELNSPRLKVTGTIYESDGKTPASNVILYIYHTNREGIYATSGDEEGWGRRHGRYRGWIQTGADGFYTFYTFRPASYPNRGEPEHIHMTVKESDKNEYYIDDIVFDDDPLLTSEKRNRLKKRGGSGIVNPTPVDDVFEVKRDIILGMNVPDYY